VVTNVHKTSNLIDIALQSQKLPNISQTFVEKMTKFVKEKKSLINVHRILHPHYICMLILNDRPIDMNVSPYTSTLLMHITMSRIR
jgi:hypothetical protein